MEDFDIGAPAVAAASFAKRNAGKDIVIKYGGAAMQNAGLKDAVMRDVALLSGLGVRITLVHGGGPEINAMLKRVGKEAVFVDGLRYTDAETMDIVAMVLAGKVNKSLVGLIHAAGGRAVGLCGADGAMLRVERRRGEPELGFVGEIKSVDAAPLEMLLSRGYIPVIATIGVDDKGELFNVNADTAAAAVAVALKADRLISMTDVRGVLADAGDDASLIETLHIGEARALIARGAAGGGMIPKLESCIAAVEGGLREACVVDGRMEHAVLRALLYEGNAVGTRFVK
jgi:acetylglutamate kinase